MEGDRSVLAYASLKTWLPEYRIAKLLFDAAHDADAIYRYCQETGIQPFIDLNSGNTGNFIYKDTFTVGSNGVPACKLGLRMKPNGVEPDRNRCKWRCPKANWSGCCCDTPCSDSPYGRVVHTPTKDNPRLFNIPPRTSEEWDKEYDGRIHLLEYNLQHCFQQFYRIFPLGHRSNSEKYAEFILTPSSNRIY